MTFPAGIMRVFSGTPPPPVLSFRLLHTAPIEHFQPSADLLFRYCAGEWEGALHWWGSGAPSSEFLLCLLGFAVWPGISCLPSLNLVFLDSFLYCPHLPPK